MIDDFLISEIGFVDIHKVDENRWNFRCPLCGDSKKDKHKSHEHKNENRFRLLSSGNIHFSGPRSEVHFIPTTPAVSPGGHRRELVRSEPGASAHVSDFDENRRRMLHGRCCGPDVYFAHSL